MKLKDFHCFTEEEGTYIINSQDMLYGKITDSLLHELQQGTLFSNEAQKLIENLCLEEKKALPAPVFRFSPPQTIVLMLTYSCNMACRYCCQGEIPDIKETEMPEEIAFKAVDWIIEHSGEHKVLDIGFFGGEPLIKIPLMKKIIAYCDEKEKICGKNFHFGGMTNGLSLTDEMIDLIVKRKMDFTISFDGPPRIQNYNRPLKNGSPSYDVILPRLKKLLAFIPEITVRPTIDANNNIDEVFNGISEAGFIKCRIEKVSSSLITEKEKHEEAIVSEAFVNHFKKQAQFLISSVKNRDGSSMKKIRLDDIFCEELRKVYRASTAPLFTPRIYFSCSVGRGMVTAAINGDLYPCPRFLALPEYKIGSVFDGTLKNDIFKKSLLIESEDCKECWARYYCGGACVVEHAGATGHIFKTNPATCRLRKAKIEQAVRVMANMDRNDCTYMKEQAILS